MSEIDIPETVKNLDTTAELFERRQKIRELIKEKFERDETKKEEKTGIEGRLEKSAEKLKSLEEYGNELILNIKVAREMREVQRRNFEENTKKDLLKQLEEESAETEEKFNEITEKWSELKSLKEPVMMYNKLEQQKENIRALLKSKDDIIQKCQDEINRINDKYYADQEKQSAEICLLVERIDTQIELIKRSYANHLNLLQDAIDEERVIQCKSRSEEWEQLFEAIRQFEQGKLKIEKDQLKTYADEIKRVCKEQQEITRATRIRVESDADALQLQLRNTQNNVLINAEKIDYNFQVLKKRNEENIVINNQQKRRLAKFKEVITSLKAKIVSIQEKSNHKLNRMSSEVKKVYDNIANLEKKTQLILQSNEKKYQQFWKINFMEAVNLTNRIFEIDRILHVEQLGVEWIRPSIIGVTAPESNKGTVHHSHADTPVVERSFCQNAYDYRLLRCILKQLSNRGGFLIEDKLLEILEPYTDAEKRLVRLDNIFNALKITEYRHVTSLIDYFIPYAWCPNCEPDNEKCIEMLEDYKDRIKCEEEVDLSTEKSSTGLEVESEVSVGETWSISTDNMEQNIDTVLKYGQEDKNLLGKKSSESICCEHALVIRPAFVLTALRSFTENYLKNNDMLNNEVANKPTENAQTPGSTRGKSLSAFQKVITNEKRKLWKTLEHGLLHYMYALKEREQLDMECESLRKQNAELKHLLEPYLAAT